MKVQRWYFSILVILTSLFVFTVYIWLISAGTSKNWPSLPRKYSQLAPSFQRGELRLQTKPSPALLALQEPYDPAERSKARAHLIFDSSFYQGKIYLYGGPRPAISLAGVQALIPINIGDQVGVSISTWGLFVIDISILLRLWRRFSYDFPARAFLVVILLTGPASALLWMLIKPKMYAAAISSGQVFLMGGFYWVNAFLEKPATSVLTAWNLSKKVLFSFGFFFPNLYNYWFNCFLLSHSFPFLFARAGENTRLLSIPRLPISWEVIIGIVINTPFIIFALLPPISMIKGWLQRPRLATEAAKADRPPTCLLERARMRLIGSIVLTFIFLLAYFCGTTRFLAAFLPSLILLAALSCIFRFLPEVADPANLVTKYNPAVLQTVAPFFGSWFD